MAAAVHLGRGGTSCNVPHLFVGLQQGDYVGFALQRPQSRDLPFDVHWPLPLPGEAHVFQGHYLASFMVSGSVHLQRLR